MQAIEVRDREIEFRLEAYARARLSPDPLAITRSRARIMREARLQFEAAQTLARLAPPVVAAPHRPLFRRVALPLLAASVWLVVAVGSIFAAQPGGPLYPARMWVETATLPSNAAARANVELGRLQARLDEALAGAARGDASAVAAALEAYRQIADETIAATNGDATLEALVAAALDRHRAVLVSVAATLADKGNATAAAAVEASIQRAIVHNQAVIDRIDEGPSDGAGNGSTGGGGGTKSDDVNGGGTGNAPTASPVAVGGTGGAGTVDGGGGGDKPAKTPKPTSEPTPEPTPRATPRPTPEHGPPDQTPRGQGD